MKLDSTMTIGCDLGTRKSELCVLGADGEVLKRTKLATTQVAFRNFFADQPRVRVVIEACTQSGWVADLLEELGHEVIVANPRKTAVIAKNQTKSDRVDAELLARLGRADPRLLSPVRLRRRATQLDIVPIRSRAELVSMRTGLVNHVRSIAKANGILLPKCQTESFPERARTFLPEHLRALVEPVLVVLEQVTEQIRALEARIKEQAERDPVVRRLQEVEGVGLLTAVTYKNTIEDASRFRRSRAVGMYIGLCPARRQSGDKDPKLAISRAGDNYLRSLLVQCAHQILGPRGADSDLRRWGLRMVERGGAGAKRRAVIAVARRLAVLMHRLWVTGAEYKPLYVENRRAA